MSSESDQQVVVGQGLALGCLALGTATVRGTRQQVQGALMAAWKSWSGAGAFPGVRADFKHNDALALLQVKPGTGGAVAGWRVHPGATAVLATGWALEAAGEHLAEHSGVDVDAWVALAWVFTQALATTDAARQG